jgi:hypothetical protein
MAERRRGVSLALSRVDQKQREEERVETRVSRGRRKFSPSPITSKLSPATLRTFLHQLDRFVWSSQPYRVPFRTYSFPHILPFIAISRSPSHLLQARHTSADESESTPEVLHSLAAPCAAFTDLSGSLDCARSSMRKVRDSISPPLPSPILLPSPSAIYPIKPLVLMPNAEQLQPDAIPFDCAFLPRFPPPHDNEEQLIVSFVRPHPSCSIVPCTAICCRECRRTGRSSLRRQEGGADLPQGASRSCLQGFRQAGTA